MHTYTYVHAHIYNPLCTPPFRKKANSTALVNARPMQAPLFHYHTGCVNAVAVLRVGKCPVCMHTYTHTYVLIHIPIHIHSYILIHIYSYIYPYICAHTYTHTYTHTCTHTYR